MTTAVYAEDLELGVPYRAGQFLVTTPDIIAFARQWDPLPIHIDEQWAAAGPFGEIVASGIHSFGIFQRLAASNVYPGWQIIAGRAVRDVLFPKPVRGGTVLSAAVVVERMEPRGRGRSLVFKTGSMWDDDGDVVFRMRAEIYMRSRPPTQRSR